MESGSSQRSGMNSSGWLKLDGSWVTVHALVYSSVLSYKSAFMDSKQHARDTYAFWNPKTVDCPARGGTGKSLRSRRIYSQAFTDDSLQIWKLHCRYRIDGVIETVPGANFVLEFLGGCWTFAKMKSNSCQKRRHSFSASNTRLCLGSR